MSPEALAIIAFLGLAYFIVRRLMLRRFFRGQLGGRTAALLYTTPLIAVAAYVAVNVDSWLIRAVLAIMTLTTYGFAEFFLRVSRGDLDRRPVVREDIRHPQG